MDEWDGEGLARLRQGLYRFFAASLLYPDPERLELLAAASELLEGEDLHSFAFYGPWQRLTRALQGPLGVGSLQAEHVRLFSAGTKGDLLPPQESFCLAPPGPAVGLIMAQVEQEYSRMGLALSPEMRSLPDHASVEMEALAFLCNQESNAWHRGSPSEAAKALGNQQVFLTAHLGLWFPIFADRFAAMHREGFYSDVVGAADAFIQHDLDLLGLLTARASSFQAGRGDEVSRGPERDTVLHVSSMDGLSGGCGASPHVEAADYPLATERARQHG